MLEAGRTFSGRTLDASESGLSLVSPSPLPLGTPLKLGVADAVVLGEVCYCHVISADPFECATGVIIKYIIFGWNQFYDLVRSGCPSAVECVATEQVSPVLGESGIRNYAI